MSVGNIDLSKLKCSFDDISVFLPLINFKCCFTVNPKADQRSSHLLIFDMCSSSDLNTLLEHMI